jgi:hypothetical protein
MLPWVQIEAHREKLVGTTTTLSVAVPRGGTLASFVLAANGSLVLKDRAVASAPVSNVGTTGTTIGNDARAATIASLSKVTVLDRALVSGRIDTTTAVQASPSSHIGGPIDTRAIFSPFVIQRLQVSFPSAADVDVVLGPDTVASRPPGRYRHINIGTRSRLKVRSGTYYAETLAVEPQSILEIDERFGPVVIYVRRPFAFRGAVSSNIVPPSPLIAVIDPGDIFVETSFSGTILGPNSRLILGGVDATTHVGSFFARDIEVRPGVKVQFKPSSALPGCDDGNSCTGRDVLEAGTCVGRDPVLFGVPESSSGGPACSDGKRPIGCRAYDCTTGLPTDVWLGAPECGPPYAPCSASCPASGCVAERPRIADLVSCECSCDSSTEGDRVSVTVDGCNPRPSTDCRQLCSAHAANACGTTSSCVLGACRAEGTLAPRTIARMACRLGDNVGVSLVGDYVATLELGSRLRLETGATVTAIPLSGTARFRFDFDAGTAFFGATTLEGGDVDLFGRRLRSSRLEVTRGAAGTVTSLGSDRYSFSFASDLLQARVTAVADNTSRAFDATIPVAVNGTLDVVGRRVELSGIGLLPSGDRISLAVSGGIANGPPKARIGGVLPRSVECNRAGGAEMIVDGSSSSDPEGQQMRFEWFRRLPSSFDSTFGSLASGPTPSVFLPLGPNVVTLVVSDPQLASARVEGIVSVLDTVPPIVTVPFETVYRAGIYETSVVVSLPDPNVTESCDPSPDVRAFIVESRPDLEFPSRVEIDPGRATFPVGWSTVVWRVTDATGNRAEATQRIQVLAADPRTPGPSLPPVQADCAAPLDLPGPATVPVDIRVCVVGRKEGEFRVGHSVWSTCVDDTCTDSRIRDLITAVNAPFAPSVQFVYQGWRRIRDPDIAGLGTCLRSPASSYGRLAVPASAARLVEETQTAMNECWRAWGLPEPGFSEQQCKRGITVILARTFAGHACGIGGVSTGSTPNFFGCDFTQLQDNTRDPLAISVSDQGETCGNTALSVAHEIGHALGLPHGDGLDNDCDGLFDDPCGLSDEINSGPPNLMGTTGGPLILTDLQRDLARTYALKSVPSLGPAGENCPAPTPPEPIDDLSAPLLPCPDGGTDAGGSSQRRSGCSCSVSTSAGRYHSLFCASFVFLLATLLRRRRR